MVTIIHPAVRNDDQTACALTTRAPPPSFQQGVGGPGVWPTVLDGMCRIVTGQSLASCAEARGGWVSGARGRDGGGRERREEGCPMAHSPRRHYREDMPSQRRGLPLGRFPQHDDAAGG